MVKCNTCVHYEYIKVSKRKKIWACLQSKIASIEDTQCPNYFSRDNAPARICRNCQWYDPRPDQDYLLDDEYCNESGNVVHSPNDTCGNFVYRQEANLT